MSVGAVNKNTGERIPTAGMPAIDNALSATSTNPVQNAIITAALADKQDKTDNALQTTDKTVVGAINEHEGDIGSLKSGLTNLNNKVTGLHNAVVFDRALTSIDVDIFESNLIWLVGFECAINANTPCGGLYVLVKQGTYISLTALKEVGTPGLSVAIKSSNVLTFSWTAVDGFGGNITMMPMIFWHD